MKEIVVDGVKYVPAAPSGKRVVIVVDRGWIYAGDVTDDKENGRIYLDRAVWVFSWKSVGFEAVLADPSKGDIRPCVTRVDMPEGAEVFRRPVADNWGLS